MAWFKFCPVTLHPSFDSSRERSNYFYYDWSIDWKRVLSQKYFQGQSVKLIHIDELYDCVVQGHCALELKADV